MMKVATVFLSILIIIHVESGSVSQSSRKKEEKSLSIALNVVAKELFEISHGKEVSVVKFRDDKQTIEALILKNIKNENFPFSVTNLNKNHDYFVLRNSGFVLSSSTKMIQNSFYMIKSDTSRAHFQAYNFYMHLQNATIDDIVSLFPKPLEGSSRIINFYSLIFNHYFFINDADHIKLVTGKSLDPERCNGVQLVEVNRFSKLANKWNTNQFTIKKFRNLHGCEFFVGKKFDENVIIQSNKLFNYNKNSLRQNTINQVNEKIFEALSEHLNYSLKYSSSGEIKQVDLRIKSFDMSRLVSLKHFYITRPYLFQSTYLADPVGRRYTELEKLFLPFDEYTWCLVTLTFAVAFLTTFGVRFVRPQVRNFIIGRGVRNPSLNIAVIWFGLSQINLPPRNFARFLVIQFIFYSLIMRTAWQGKVYEFMQKDMRKRQIRDIDEVAGQNFSIFVGTSLFITSDLKRT